MDGIDWNILARYLARELSDAERHRVEQWLNADPSRYRLLADLSDVWDAAESSLDVPSEEEVEADWKQVQHRMQEGGSAPAPKRDRTARPPRSARRSAPRRAERRTRRRMAWTQYGVLVLAGVLLAVFAVQLVVDTEPEVVPTPEFREVVTQRAERATIQLPDGTTITLNVDSRLWIPNGRDTEVRRVKLEGEAFFDVATDSTRPFKVEVKEARIDVHGTAFNVRSYPEDEDVQVAVTDGVVSLYTQQRANEGARLERGHVGRLAHHGVGVMTMRADVSKFVGWTEGRLVFDDEPMSSVAARLSRWYDIDIRIESERLQTMHLTANLKSQPLEEMLSVIATTLGIEYQMHEHSVLLHPAPEASS